MVNIIREISVSGAISEMNTTIIHRVAVPIIETVSKVGQCQEIALVGAIQ